MMLAKDIMTTNVATVAPDSTVEAISRLMLTRNISGVPVVDEKGAILGIVTEGDLILRPQSDARGAGGTSWWLCLFSDSRTNAADYIKTHGTRADEVMTRDVITVREDAPVGDIARILAEKRIKRVPVVHDGVLVGIVSRTNLLRGMASRDEKKALTQDDRAIRQAILREVEAQDWITHGTLNVIVAGGIVELWGWIETEEERHALLLLARGVDGVQSVVDHLFSMQPYLQGG
jgi:CBS domain-containing protein